MKVRLNQIAMGPDTSKNGRAGTIIDVDAKTAKAYIDGGYAVALARGERETAQAPNPEVERRGN